MSLTVDWKSPHTKRIIVSYLPDWILIVLMVGAFYGIDHIPPFRREFSLEDKTIMFPHAPADSVPMWVVGVICLVAPIVFIAILSLGFKRSLIDFHSGILGLGLSLSMCLMLTTIIKITVGRPRPDFIDRCQPPEGAADPPFGLSNYTICTSPLYEHDMVDAFKSFPSGHSSFSFAGLVYLALFIAGKMQMFDERGHTYKGFIFTFPFIGALLVAISRTQDYRHHWQDVFIGSLLGSACAFFAYRQYYPSLAHASCHHPYKGRIHFFKHGSNDRIQRFNNQHPGPGDSEHGLLDDNNSYPMHNTQHQQYPFNRDVASSSYNDQTGKM